MHFVFEIAFREPCDWIPALEKYGPVTRVRFLWFSWTYVSMSYSDFENKTILTAMKYANDPRMIEAAKELENDKP